MIESSSNTKLREIKFEDRKNSQNGICDSIKYCLENLKKISTELKLLNAMKSNQYGSRNRHLLHFISSFTSIPLKPSQLETNSIALLELNLILQLIKCSTIIEAVKKIYCAPRFFQTTYRIDLRLKTRKIADEVILLKKEWFYLFI
ncbi:hypothetical protein BpHYR1_050180 [Brachionus plicatilis]|uniref:Uncharacterized protein n=1 Tax=Brachionus plicatilis TaxID=10195 RepID=A0A3M7S134_BRAPC|nr:hypothetical protein BpHYR1_050180 [Brachionus plicatilis]